MVPALTFYCVPAIILLLIALRKHQKRKWGKCTNNVKLTDKIAIVTGANSGIGFEIAKNLAIREAEVIFACRNLQAARDAIKRIKSEVALKASLVAMELDLASIKSIKKFSAEIHQNYSQIHLLFDNAGVSYPKNVRVETEDGFEVHFGVNHLGHFLLTNLLLDKLKASAPSRIIITSSLLHEKGQIYLDDLNAERENGNLYANSKLMNAYFGKELAEKLQGTGVNVYVCCPGWVYSGLFRHHKWKWYQLFFIAPIAFLFMRSAKEGSQTPIYCATEPSLSEENGNMYRDCKKYISKIALHDSVSKRLWDVSNEMVSKKDGNYANKI